MSDAAILEGLAAQLAGRDDTAIGWKVGFAAPAQRAAFGTSLALTGWLSSARVLDSGATVSLDGWVKPVLEAEVAVRIDADLPPDCTPGLAARAVGAVASAIELADLDGPVDDARSIVTGNVFHRHVVLGPWNAERAGLDLGGVTLTLRGTDGADVEGAGPEDLLGPLADLVAGVAQRLAPAGATVCAGDVIITGAVVPPVPVAAGQTVAVDFAGLSPLSLSFAA